MDDTGQPKVISTASFSSLRLIDGGDTVIMTFKVPDGSETSILVPREAALTVQTHLAEILAIPLTRKRYES